MCAIVGIYSNQAAGQLHEALIQLQHRGQDGAGIVTCDQHIHIKRGKGLVQAVFDPSDIAKLTGNIGIAHARYPTSGGNHDNEIQPFWLGQPYGIALAHNGQLTNHDQLKIQLERDHRRYLPTDSDSETLIHLLATSLEQQAGHDSIDFVEALATAVTNIFATCRGSYSVVCTILGKGLVAFRDPHGIRPLVMGEREHDGGTDVIFASENAPFFSLGFSHKGDVAPGEMVYIDLEGNCQRRQLQRKSFRPCIFEYVYFARPDAHLNDVSVYRARLRMGQNLAQRWQALHPDKTPDVVIPVPFTSNTAALSFAQMLGVRYSEGLYKNAAVGRTFIMNTQDQRRLAVRRKLSPQPTEIKGKAVLLLDDSIVRGTTSQQIVAMVKEMGATKVYLVSACPPIKHPCFYGVDIPTRDELIAAKQDLAAIKKHLDVDELMYQDIADLEEAVTRKGEHAITKPCRACMDGDYFCGKEEA